MVPISAVQCSLNHRLQVSLLVSNYLRNVLIDSVFWIHKIYVTAMHTNGMIHPTTSEFVACNIRRPGIGVLMTISGHVKYLICT